MTPKKANLIIQQLTNDARKVYDAVPILQEWSATTILGELQRGGSRWRIEIVMGCLRDLCERGLVRRTARSTPGSATFQRIHSNADLAAASADQAAESDDLGEVQMRALAASAEEQREASSTPLGKMELLAQRLHGAANTLIGLQKELRLIADDIERIALENEERVAAAGGDGEKLRQLKALLQGIAS